MRWGLAQADVSWYDGVEHHVAEMSLELLVYLVSESQTGIVHRKQESLDLKRRIKTRLYDADGVDEFGDTFKGKILGLYRNNDRIGCRQSIDSDQAERRRAVDDDWGG